MYLEKDELNGWENIFLTFCVCNIHLRIMQLERNYSQGTKFGYVENRVFCALPLGVFLPIHAMQKPL